MSDTSATLLLSRRLYRHDVTVTQCNVIVHIVLLLPDPPRLFNKRQYLLPSVIDICFSGIYAVSSAELEDSIFLPCIPKFSFFKFFLSFSKTDESSGTH